MGQFWESFMRRHPVLKPGPSSRRRLIPCSNSEKTVEELKQGTDELVKTTKKSIEEGLSRLSVAVEEAKKAAEQKRRELEEELS